MPVLMGSPFEMAAAARGVKMERAMLTQVQEAVAKAVEAMGHFEETLVSQAALIDGKMESARTTLASSMAALDGQMERSVNQDAAGVQPKTGDTSDPAIAYTSGGGKQAAEMVADLEALRQQQAQLASSAQQQLATERVFNEWHQCVSASNVVVQGRFGALSAFSLLHSTGGPTANSIESAAMPGPEAAAQLSADAAKSPTNANADADANADAVDEMYKESPKCRTTIAVDPGCAPTCASLCYGGRARRRRQCPMRPRCMPSRTLAA